jgi:hypothetical protein
MVHQDEGEGGINQGREHTSNKPTGTWYIKRKGEGGTNQGREHTSN